MFSIGRSPKNIILNKKDRQRGLTALWNYLLKPWLHVDAIPVSDRNKPGVTSQKIMEFLRRKTLLALFSTLCSLLHRSSSHIAAIQGKGRSTWTCWLPNVTPDVLCFLTNYYKIIDMFLNHTPCEGMPIDGPFPSKGQIRCQGAFLNSRTKSCVFNPC